MHTHLLIFPSILDDDIMTLSGKGFFFYTPTIRSEYDEKINYTIGKGVLIENANSANEKNSLLRHFVVHIYRKFSNLLSFCSANSLSFYLLFDCNSCIYFPSWLICELPACVLTLTFDGRTNTLTPNLLSMKGVEKIKSSCTWMHFI